MQTPRLLDMIDMDCPFCHSITPQLMAECDGQMLAWCQRCFRPRVVDAPQTGEPPPVGD